MTDDYRGPTVAALWATSRWKRPKAVCDGDTITIDIPQRGAHLHVGDEEIRNRLAQWRRPPLRFSSGYLALYAGLAESADQGALIRHRPA
ncbi:MAG: dihydroxy-acid dehydratase [Planctomycetota bacterium]|nr:dihydroxy-acid dehydratase [Planctomycetota bacterium]